MGFRGLGVWGLGFGGCFKGSIGICWSMGVWFLGGSSQGSKGAVAEDCFEGLGLRV